jgi:hypothetical protein
VFLFRGKILNGGFVMKILSEDPPRIKTTYITHVDLQGICTDLYIYLERELESKR